MARARLWSLRADALHPWLPLVLEAQYGPSSAAIVALLLSPMDSSRQRAFALPRESLELLNSPHGCSLLDDWSALHGLRCRQKLRARWRAMLWVLSSIRFWDARPNSPRQHEGATRPSRRPSSIGDQAQATRRFALAEPGRAGPLTNPPTQAEKRQHLEAAGPSPSVDPFHGQKLSEAAELEQSTPGASRIAWRNEQRAGPHHKAAPSTGPRPGPGVARPKAAYRPRTPIKAGHAPGDTRFG